MKYLSYLLNHLLIISNLLFNKKIFNKKSDILRPVMLIELCPIINLQTSFHVILASILNKKYKINFFYFGSIKMNLLTLLLRSYLKKIGFTILDLNNNLKKKEWKSKFFSKEQFINHTYKGFKIGKYIYQSYCRNNLNTSLNLDDKKLYALVSLSHSRIDYLEKFFRENKVKYLLTTHVVFIDYGLIALVARKYNCKIKIIYPEKNYGKLRTLTVDYKYLLQIDKYYDYKKEFKKYKNKRKCLGKSKKELNERINKNITNSKVSNVSAYSKSKIIKLDSKKPKIIILPSCFFDAQYFFRNSIFFDVYEWLDFTLYHASLTEFEWYVKPHPTNIPMNYKIFENLKKKYKKIKFLDPSVSNLTFKKNKFSSMFTFQSGAVLEFAYMNIPSVVVSDNICVNYEFGKPVKSINIYKKLIYNANKINNNIKFNDVLENNYMWRFDKSSSFRVDFIEDKITGNTNNIHSIKSSNEILNKFFSNSSFQRNLTKVIPKIFI